jgi:hypothetical protein
MLDAPKATASAVVGAVVVTAAALVYAGPSDAERSLTPREQPAVVPVLVSAEGAAAKPTVHVWKDPTCGCCSLWVEHLRAAGYAVEVEETPDLRAIKRAKGIPRPLTSCHTATVDGYVIEGHVPADVIDRVLAERPDVAGLAVPGMPVGSPGMEIEGQAPVHYEIVAFTSAGETNVYDRR